MINPENIEQIAELVSHLEVLENQLENSYERRKKEIFEKAKKEVLKICEEINNMI